MKYKFSLIELIIFSVSLLFIGCVLASDLDDKMILALMALFGALTIVLRSRVKIK